MISPMVETAAELTDVARSSALLRVNHDAETFGPDGRDAAHQQAGVVADNGQAPDGHQGLRSTLPLKGDAVQHAPGRREVHLVKAGHLHRAVGLLLQSFGNAVASKGPHALEDDQADNQQNGQRDGRHQEIAATTASARNRSACWWCRRTNFEFSLRWHGKSMGRHREHSRKAWL